MLANKLMSALSGAEDKLYVDDVFSTYLRTGTGADAVVNTGIDMAKGYMLWSKGRSGATDHAIYDSARGLTYDLASNTTAAQTTQATGLKAVSATGHTVGSLAKMNTSAATYVDFVFRRSPKFFDVVTYTGDGTAGRQIPHGLGIAPGMVIIKATSSDSNWSVASQITGGNVARLLLDSASQASSYLVPSDAFSASAFNVSNIGSASPTNTNSVSYVAYLFAHDPSADGIIQCGSFTTDASGNATVNLGWEPQYRLLKPTSAVGDWQIHDSARGATADAGYAILSAQSTMAESFISTGYYRTNATGFTVNAGATGYTFIYLAIRRPNKPPTTGTQVYNAIARTGTGAAATVNGVGFAPDLVIGGTRNTTDTVSPFWFDRLRGASAYMRSSATNAEVAITDAITAFLMDGVSVGDAATNAVANVSGNTYANWFFKRAPGILSQICYSGTGSNKAEAHDLGVAPELWLVKGRSGATQWVWGSSLLAATEKIVMPTPAGKVTDATAWNSTYPTASVLSLGTAAAVNSSAATYTAYLWTTKAGVSKVFGYVGNGSSQNIDCGFTTGARFILIVRTNAAGSVYIWDTVRGVVAGNDPHLALDTTAAEVTTDDSVDPLASGFSVNQLAATNINVNGSTYIGLAYA